MDNKCFCFVIVQLLSCVWLSATPMDCNPPGASVYGIFQARILEWVAISFSRGSSQPRDWACISFSGRQIPYYWATREYPGNVLTYHINKPKEKNHAVMFVKAETGWQNSPAVHYKSLSKLEMQSFCNLIISFWKEKARHGKWCHLMVNV